MSAAHDEQRQKTQQYVKEHHVRELFSYLTQGLVYYRPENPRQFIQQEIRKMRISGVQSLFTDEDITTMFEMIDVTKQGTISGDQLRNTCKNLASDGASGGSDIDEEAIIAVTDARNRVNLDGFRRVISAQLATKAHWLTK